MVIPSLRLFPHKDIYSSFQPLCTCFFCPMHHLRLPEPGNQLSILSEMATHHYLKTERLPKETSKTQGLPKELFRSDQWGPKMSRSFPSGLDYIRPLNFCMTLSQVEWRVSTKHTKIDFPPDMGVETQSRRIKFWEIKEYEYSGMQGLCSKINILHRLIN